VCVFVRACVCMCVCVRERDYTGPEWRQRNGTVFFPREQISIAGFKADFAPSRVGAWVYYRHAGGKREWEGGGGGGHQQRVPIFAWA